MATEIKRSESSRLAAGSRSRFGGLSSNMFFTRNTAKPKRVKHIEGLNGALICNVNDDEYISPSSSSLNFIPTNNLMTFEIPRRVEKLVPPTGFWNTYGVIHDTERWKQELAALASASGLEIENEQKQQNNDLSPKSTANNKNDSRSGAHYSTKTGRFNEGQGKSRGRTSSKHATALNEALFSVPENERDMWMLQVLCQLLNTSNLEDVQSWLVSASPTEKEQARGMINSALKGLKESERISSKADQLNNTIDLNALRKNDDKKASKKYVKDSLNRSLPAMESINEEDHTFNPTINDSWNNNTEVSAATKNSDNSSNLTTYKRAFRDYDKPYQQSTYSFNSSEDQTLKDDDDEVETIQLDNERSKLSSVKNKRNKKVTSSQQQHRQQNSSSTEKQIETLQLDDDDTSKTTPTIIKVKPKNEQNEEDDEEEEDNKRSPSITNMDPKTKKIHLLKNKLSRQEEQSKKQLNELQTKQSRLENAIKLLVKQTSQFQQKQRPLRTNNETDENSDAPIVNVIIQSPRSKTNTTVHHPNTGTKNTNGGIDSIDSAVYKVNDVRVQISLSRLDDKRPKVYSGIWKPDESTLRRLQST
ncbi:unnamed protein product [Didymodactylos carnosus]|uniref:Uncharacterized protein n=1 Tax=Didymodactylos carnosus TaxID=1234261 RepID=A0A814JBZ4_9BILA|nr:unnamed protein product [Didymodactylos carnosus]CAF1180984.1 unnamed protein product [Didymodactylos carnosus]CAF3804283.1 unnamed protein product [Didymodactylos carnosus]CAF3992236.1 unnamed protein product [Didymodactylos carnosus]